MEIRRLERDEVAGVWSIDRAELIDRVYRHQAGELVLETEHHDLRGWPQGESEHYGPLLLDCVEHGGVAYGAFEDDTLIGAVVVESRFIGRAEDRLQLKFLHVSCRHRRSGLGRTLFERAVATAKAMGARQLYISATSSENTVQFYLRRNCRVATELDPALFALEPEDIHLEFDIPA